MWKLFKLVIIRQNIKFWFQYWWWKSSLLTKILTMIKYIFFRVWYMHVAGVLHFYSEPFHITIFYKWKWKNHSVLKKIYFIFVTSFTSETGRRISRHPLQSRNKIAGINMSVHWTILSEQTVTHYEYRNLLLKMLNSICLQLHIYIIHILNMYNKQFTHIHI